MRDTEFEPFGEPIKRRGSLRTPVGQSAGQRLMLRSGVGIFWVLLAGIVAARAIYFNPNFAETFQHVAMLVR